MKVKDAAGTPPVNTSSPRETTRRDGLAPSGSPDKVSTTATARLDASLAAVRAGAGQDRAARLDALATAIRDGTFKPDPRRIARGMTDDAELTKTLRGLLAE